MKERAEEEGPWGGEPRVLILGIGNVLWADEGFGVRAVEEVARRCRFAGNVRILDGGTQGIYLVDQVRWAQVLVVFDAVDYGLPPGTLRTVEGDEVPRFLGAKKMSLHQTGFQEVLAMASLLGDYPRQLLLVGCQPVELEDFGGSLRAPVKACIGPAVSIACDWLARLGVSWEPVRGEREPCEGAGARVGESGAGGPGRDRSHAASTDGAAAPVDLPDRALSLAAYEQGRPDERTACRRGDPRVLAAWGARRGAGADGEAA